MSLAEKEKPDNTTFWLFICALAIGVLSYFASEGIMNPDIIPSKIPKITRFPTEINLNNSDIVDIVDICSLDGQNLESKPKAWCQNLNTIREYALEKNLTLNRPNGEPYVFEIFEKRKNYADIRIEGAKEWAMNRIFKNLSPESKVLIIDDNFMNTPSFLPKGSIPSWKKGTLELLQRIITKANKLGVSVELAIQPFEGRSVVQIGTKLSGNWKLSFQLPAVDFADFKNKLAKLGRKGSTVIIYQQVNGKIIDPEKIEQMTAYALKRGHTVQLF